ncbi:MAG: pyruvate kinase [Pseudomonadota bacterium]|uniref:Pyruvate kinase n=1 Tax=Candidatus Desulfatibia profunda TaxID=2841695 RepID=A0A8J6NVY5_9BACT|nr:pyruvate kinase [Candidatus Desulfatibia profunda]MBL7179184.1 pyruvate kinase [Desulfobacterales bacterium]MBU0698207.1 pyruvate kinase [Pseudomonadota bacterium]
MRIDTDLKLLIYRRTKIVATLGPSSNDTATIEHLIAAGVDVFRLNMSHGTHDGHRNTYQRIRAAADKLEKLIGVLADLCGPKIRVGKFQQGRIELTVGDSVTVTTRDVVGRPGLIPSQYRALAADVEIGNRILLDDGNLELVVKSVDGSEITCQVVSGGILSDHKGMNLPGVKISSPALTETDRVDAHFALQLGVDFLALSFVRRASDIEDLRALVSKTTSHVAIVAKIEKPEALDNIDEILDAADAIMVARGDLGVELPPQAVPNAQVQLIDLARVYRKPVIVATQMLESMIDHPRPTRAEVSDVANAVRSGADAVMLSAETASGKHPVEAVKMMNDIARQTEAYLWSRGAFGSLTRRHETARPFAVEDALSESMAQLSRDLLVRAIMVISRQDHSLAVMSSSRPAAPIIGICLDQRSSRIANLLWGVIPTTATPSEVDHPNSLAKRIVVELGLAVKGHTILVVRGFSSDPQQNAPSVTVVTV